MDSLQMVHLVNKRLPELQRDFGAVPFIGVASNPFTTPMEISVQRLHNKRHAGARFSQTQAITNVGVYASWYEELREGRNNEPRMTIPVDTPGWKSTGLRRALPVARSVRRSVAASGDGERVVSAPGAGVGVQDCGGGNGERCCRSPRHELRDAAGADPRVSGRDSE